MVHEAVSEVIKQNCTKYADSVPGKYREENWAAVFSGLASAGCVCKAWECG
jgi:hypothetical protein